MMGEKIEIDQNSQKRLNAQTWKSRELKIK
jgi:hypothetical protein